MSQPESDFLPKLPQVVRMAHCVDGGSQDEASRKSVKQVLTPGRWRGLKAASNSRNIFNILAFDQRGTLVKMMPPGSSYDSAVHIKTEIVVKLSDYVSAVLLDPEYGLSAALTMNGHTGLLMAIEKSGYDGGPTNCR